VAVSLFALHADASNSSSNSPVPNVTFCPNGGSHVGQVQNLKLSTPMNSTIYYTLDGTPASLSSTLYVPGSSVAVTSTKTVCSMAVVNGVSGQSSCQVFTVTGGTLSSQVAAPVFSLNGGTVRVGDKVLISTPTTDADLYWTAAKNYSVPGVCNWKAPSKGKLVVNFASTTMNQVTIGVFAAKTGMLHSEVRQATFTVQKADEDFSIGLGASRVKFKEKEL